MYRVLIVEDDPLIASKIISELSRWDLEAAAADDFSDVMRTFGEFSPQLVIMDISLPYYNGYYWCERIREVSKVPVIFLSSRADNMDIVMAVNMGGDDYIAKPVSMEVLTAKIRSMLRRAYDYEMNPPLTLRGAVLDTAALCLTKDGGRIPLTRNEVRILSLLLASGGETVTREKLMLALWDSDEFVDDNTLTVNINRLRRKLEEAGLNDCIVTHRNRGYAVNA